MCLPFTHCFFAMNCFKSVRLFFFSWVLGCGLIAKGGSFRRALSFKWIIISTKSHRSVSKRIGQA